MGDLIKAILAIALYLGIPIASLAAWINHIVICIQDESWLLLLAGAILFPIGIVHGAGSWFGWF